jgi:ubiquitin carboxyl-terminal hydrolase 8
VEGKEEKEERRAARAWQQYLTKNSSVVVDLFQGQLKSTVTCLTCRYASTTFDTFMYLSVPIPKTDRPVTLVDCLIEFTKNEILPENSWVCPNCCKAVKALKRIDIWKVPPLLIIHLKRFYYDKNSYGKLVNRVDYPLSRLDITQYVSGPQKEPPVYDLFAKTDHEGDMGAGHYVAYAKNASNRIWHYFDDERVHQVDASEVATDMAYLLFYCKVSITQYRRQSSKMPNLWPHVLSRTESFGSDTQDQTTSTVSGGDMESKRKRKKPLGVIHEDPSL